MTENRSIPAVRLVTAHTGASASANELGMRPMQERAYAHRGEQYLLIKSPPASGKSRALMFIALDKLHNQGVKQAIIVVPERSIGGSFANEPLSKHGFYWDWSVKPHWNLCNAPGADDVKVAKSKVKAVAEFLASDDKVLVCTHATFRFAIDELGIEAFDNRLIAVDEFHHVSANPDNRLGAQLGQLIARDTVHLVAMTGSYFRGDAVAVLAPQDEAKFTTVTYTYYEQLNGYEYLKTLDIAYSLHGAAGVRRPVGGPAPLLLQSGWTDALFPVGQSLAIRARFPGNVRLQLGDIGHAPAANRPGDVALFNEQGREFLKDQLVGGGPRLRRPPVTALPMRCSGQGGGPAFPGVNVRRTLRFGTERRLRIDARGASSRLAAAVNPLGPTGSHCTRHRADLRNRAQFSVRSRGVTLLGQPVITGRVTASGRLGQIAARVWDRDRRTDRQRLITRGVFRLKDDERGRFRFTLDGNAWHFARGHRIVVELLGRDAPTYAASPASFRASLTDVRVTLPVRRRR